MSGNKTTKIDKAKVLSVAIADIKRADAYYSDQIESTLQTRYEVYFADTERYKKLFPKLSRKNEMRTFDLWSAVEWLLPTILKAFFGSNRIISVSGVGAEDAEQAEKVMELIQWQLTVKNQGYKVFKSWFGDALATNLGVLKCYWKRETEIIPHQEVMDEAALVGILQDHKNKVKATEPMPTMDSILGLAPQNAMVAWDEERVIINQPIIEAIKPSDIRFTPDGKTLSECSMVAHRKVMTINDLRKEARRGVFDSAVVEDIASSADDDIKPTEIEKYLNGDEGEKNDAPEQARRRVVVYECYLKTDIDGDGLLEDAIVTVCNDKLLRAVENPYKRVPFFDLVPFFDSYRVWGKMGLAEVVQDIQDTHTALLRQMIVALGLGNQWRAVVDETAVNMEDLINDSMFIRSKGEPGRAFANFPHDGVNPQNFQFFEYLKTQLEQFTPNTRYNQGTDASSLNKTATGINMIMTAAQQRQEEIIRNFAETGIRELFRFLIQLNQRYLDQEQIVRLQNKTINFAPDDIMGDYDLSVDASSGVGAVDSKVQVLTSYLREMFPAALQIGAAEPGQFVLAAQKLLKLMGIEDAEKYLLSSEVMQQRQLQQQQMAIMGGMPVGGGQEGAIIEATPTG